MVVVTSFDEPIYKVLANNDTGASAGHQGGFVLPKDLEDYLPLLRNATSAKTPTVDVEITADLYDGISFIETVTTRYQYQTWGGERSPERRITRNLSRLLNRAEGGDVLIIERGIEVDTHYRFRLIKASNPVYPKLIASFGKARWGPLNAASPPSKETEALSAETEIEAVSAAKFELFDHSAGLSELRTRRVARSRAFKRLVSSTYGGTCSFCGGGLLHPDGRTETEAGHIVSRSLRGSDDVRNGLLLCKSHHWAFDVGLIGVLSDYTLTVPSRVKAIGRNVGLASLDRASIRLPAQTDRWPALDALAWHRANVLLAT